MKKIVLGLALAAGLILSSNPLLWAQGIAPIEGLLKLCDEGNSTACFKAGEKYRTLDKDKKQALKYYLLGCDKGHLDACTFAGILTAQKGRPEWKKATKLFEKGCDAKQVFACFNLGSLKYKEGRASSAKKYFKKACEMGHVQACTNYRHLNK